jgi:iron complex outermembrane receptor protein
MTGLGEFEVGGMASHFTRFDQNIGGGTTFSVLNTTGFNETFPSIQDQARAYVNWSKGAFSGDIFANYIGGYRNWSTTTLNPLISTGGVPTGGGDDVDANTLWDIHLAWSFSEAGALGDSEVFLDVANIFDTDPPFYNASTGYDRYGANPIGRVVTLGLRGRW